MKKQKLLNNKNIIIIDIRESNDFINEHLINSINIPYHALLENFQNYLNYRIRYYLLCYNGITSKKAYKTIKKQGYKVKYIKGGYNKLLS